MVDIEKVVRGLEICSNTGKSCCPESCPYYKEYTSCQSIELKIDALKLLKEQRERIKNLEDMLKESELRI